MLKREAERLRAEGRRMEYMKIWIDEKEWTWDKWKRRLEDKVGNG